MHPELENLLAIALKDGSLSDKEREILFRKAEKLDVDMDEFEMELEGRLSEKNESSISGLKAQFKGERIPYFTDLLAKLQLIDDEIANIRTTISSKVEGTVNNVIDTLLDNNPVQYGVDAVKSIFGGTTSQEKKAIAKENEENHRINLLIKKKVTIVSSYPLSHEIADSLEFVTLCISNFKTIENKYEEDEIYDSELELMYAWKNKAEQIISNLKLLDLSDDLKTKIEKLESTLNPPKKKKSFWEKLS